MNLDRIFNIGAAIVTVALVYTLVSHKETAHIIQAFGSSFSGAIKSATGQK